MAKKKSGLGAGLESIFGPEVTKVIENIQDGTNAEQFGFKTQLPIAEIRPNPYQPRKVFDQDKLNELAQSIKEQGVFNPILVKKSTVGYELIAGERRLKASQIAGLKEIPAIVMEFNDQQMMEISLLENIQREDLNVIEEANAYEQLMNKLDYTQEKLAERIGKSREHVANTLRLLKLPKDVQKLVEEHKLTMGHVRPLITLKPAEISEIANKAVDEGLSVRAVEALVNQKKNDANKPKKEKKVDPYIADVTNTLQQKFSSKVKITSNSINISFENTDDLNRILEILEVIE